MKTKELILHTALQLFNEKGTAAISTNHIADAAAISPGNLYYHYRSKEEIIRGIFEMLFARWDTTFQVPTEQLPGLQEIRQLFAANFELLWEYRFIYRELPALLRRDEELRSRYLAVRQRGFDGFQALFAAFATAGVLTQTAPETVDQLAELCWLLSEFWLASLEINGKEISPAEIQRGLELMNTLLRPYLA